MIRIEVGFGNQSLPHKQLSMLIRQPNDSDIPQLQAFAARHFGNSHSADLPFTRFWFYREQEGWTIRILEDDAGLIAGLIYYIQAPARLHGQSVSMYWISTLFVDEARRQGGAGARLLLHAYKTLPLLGSMCGNHFSIPLSQMLGQTVADHKIRRFLYLLDPLAVQLAPPEVRAQLNEQQERQQLLSAPTMHGEWAENLPDCYDALWHEFSLPLTCCIERSRDYMNRRYREAPYINYRFLLLWCGSELVGVVTVRLQSCLGKVISRIVDFVATPKRSAEVWSQTLIACRDIGAIFADFFVLGSYQDSALLEAGWQLATDENNLEYIPNLLTPLDYRRWSYSFHLGGTSLVSSNTKLQPDQVWFTKGDGDRDWPTPQLIAEQKA